MKEKFTERQRLAFSLSRELDDVWDQISKLGFYRLPEPIQKGWRMQFKVRDDILSCSDGNRYKEILKVIQNTRISRTTDFTEYDSRYPLELKSIFERDRWNGKVKFPEFYWDKYFYLTRDFSSYYRTGIEIKYQNAYIVKNSFRFETEIVPNMIESIRIMSPELESRKKQINNKIEKENLWGTIKKIHGRRSGKDWYGREYKDDLEELFYKEIWEELND